MAVPLKTRELWSSLHAFVRERGGDVISVQYAFPALIRCTPDSTLPRELEMRRVEFRTPPSPFPDAYGFEVTKTSSLAVPPLLGGDTRRWIEPVAVVEIIELTARASGAKRIVAHAHIGERDEFEVKFKPLKRGA